MTTDPTHLPPLSEEAEEALLALARLLGRQAAREMLAATRQQKQEHKDRNDD